METGIIIHVHKVDYRQGKYKKVSNLISSDENYNYCEKNTTG